MRRIIVDFDGVMCNMHNKLLLLYNQIYNTNYTTDDITDWVLPKGSREIFTQTEGFFADLPPIDGAIEGVNELSKKYEVFFATDAASTPIVAHDKIAWWKSHNLDHIPIVIIGHKYIIDADLIIDDAPHHVEYFLRSHPDKQAILVDALYNKKVKTGKDSRVYRAENWSKVVELADKLLN